jgi:hypothetical protein
MEHGAMSGCQFSAVSGQLKPTSDPLGVADSRLLTPGFWFRFLGILGVLCGLLLGSAAAQCGTAPTTLYLGSNAAALAGTDTLRDTSGSETMTRTSVLTAQTTATWFWFQPAVTSSASVAGDSSTAGQNGWLNRGTAAGTNPGNGCTIPAGTWTFSASLRDTSGAQSGAILSVHIYKENGGSFSAEQCNLQNANVSLSTSIAAITASGSCPAMDFVTGDAIYVEAYLKSGTSNSSSSGTATTNIGQLGANDYISHPLDQATGGGGYQQKAQGQVF